MNSKREHEEANCPVVTNTPHAWLRLRCSEMLDGEGQSAHNVSGQNEHSKDVPSAREDHNTDVGGMNHRHAGEAANFQLVTNTLHALASS